MNPHNVLDLCRDLVFIPNSQWYDGIVLKRGMPLGNAQDRRQRFWENLSYEIQIQESQKRVGNNEGLRMWDTYDKMEEKMAEVREKDPCGKIIHLTCLVVVLAYKPAAWSFGRQTYHPRQQVPSG